MTEPEPGPTVWPALTLESVDPELIGVDVERGAVSQSIAWCLQALSMLIPEPTRARLVLTGDFVASVRNRHGDARTPEPFDLARGSGFVGGKTIPMPDGTTDVLLHAGFFLTHDDPAEQGAFEQLVKRTAVHEAQHVAMHQNDQTYQAPSDTAWRLLNLSSAAASVLDEYRAELGVSPALREGDLEWDGVAVLATLSAELGRVVVDYQEHLDVDRLVYDVGTVGLIAWRSLAYLAAWRRVRPDDDPVTPEVAAHPLWQRMAARRWGRFIQVLEVAEPGTIAMERADIATIVSELADVLGAWLLDLGFRWTTEDDEGRSQFCIEHWYFADHDFLSALAHKQQ